MMNRFLLCALALSLVGILAARPAVAEDHVVFQFVQTHCVVCHSSDGLSDELKFEDLQGVRTFEQHREVWELVAEKVRSSEMPPPGEPQPEPDEALAIVRWLSQEFERQDLAIPPQPGHVTARRLNRAEYVRTIRDLLGVDIELGTSFPADPSAFGFDNISDALRLSPVLLEKYLDTAEIAVHKAIFGPPPQKPAVTHYPVPVRINTPRGKVELPDDLFDYDFSGLSTVHSAHVVHRFPVDGEYSFRLVLNGHRPNQSEPARPALYMDGRFVAEAEVDATDMEGQVVDLKAWVTAGEHLLSATYLKTYHGLPASYGGPEPSKRPAIPLLSKNARGELTPEDIEVLRKFGTRIKTDAIEARVDNRFESIAVRGPLEQNLGASAESREKIFGADFDEQQMDDAEVARAMIARLMERAFRRPVTAAEVDAYLKLFEMAREEGDGFEEAIALSLQAILIAPDFLYRIERGSSSDDGERIASDPDSVPVSDYELASRLSYFLWSSMPDAELFQLASERQLRKREVLENQVRRMLQDEKAQALVENFFGQWLQFRNVELVQPDPGRYPDFEESLRRSMREETEYFLGYLLREDRSILEMLDSNYTFVNERLARFYGIPDVEGPEFRRVDVSGLSRGGGILSHAGILTLSSYSTRTSPVLRGKWILETLLNAPPPPPPPSVPELDETNLGETVSLREGLAAHSRDPACASCHARMDPLGFGLEHFDAIGAWRDTDGQHPVDASGTLPGGQSFRGHEELIEILKEDRDTIVRGLTENLLIYALGRGLERYDRPAVRSIVSSLPDADYRFSELIIGIVDSLPFQMRNVMDDPDSAVSTEDDEE